MRSREQLKFFAVRILALVCLSVLGIGESAADEMSPGPEALSEGKPPEFKRTMKTKPFGLGFSAQSISSSAINLVTGSPFLSYLKEIGHGPLQFSFFVSPHFQTSGSLFGLSAEGDFGWRFFGRRARTDVVQADQFILAQNDDLGTAYAGSVNLGLSTLFVFGTTATVTYSGPTVRLALDKLRGFQYTAHLKFSLLTSGTRSLNMISLGVSIPIGL